MSIPTWDAHTIVGGSSIEQFCGATVAVNDNEKLSHIQIKYHSTAFENVDAKSAVQG